LLTRAGALTRNDNLELLLHVAAQQGQPGRG
jgi:hypothetical protein